MQTKQNTFMESKIGEVLKKKRSLIEQKKPQIQNTSYPIVSLKQPIDRSLQYVKFQILLPGFLRLQLKNVTQIQLENLKGQINATLIFTIYYGDLLKSQMLGDWMPRDESERKKVQDSILDALKNQFCIQFSQGQSISLTEGKQMIPRNPEQYKKLKQNDSQQIKKNLEVTVKHQEEKKQIKFSVRRLFEVSLQSQITLAPFDLTYCYLSMTIQPIQVNYTMDTGKTNKQIQLNIEVNLLDTDRINEKFSHTQVLQFGEYGVACSLRKVLYDDEWIQDFLTNGAEKSQKQKKQQMEKRRKIKLEEEDQQRIFTEPKYVQYRKQYREKLKKTNKLKAMYEIPDQNQLIFNKYWAKREDLTTKSSSGKTPTMKGFHYACFVLPLFKHPLPILFSIFAPVVFLALLNLIIFFQDPNLATRICSIATLMVAFIALFPTIRAQIPPSSQVMVLEVVVYLFISTSLLALVQSWRVRDFDGATQQIYSFVWYQSPEFVIALIIDIICVIVIVVLVLIHGYSSFGKSQEEYDDYHQFDREQWKNDLCEKKFNSLYSQDKVKKSQNLKVLEIRG